MARLKPVGRGEFVRRLRELGFEGPFQSGKHPYMTRGETRLTIPNPHRSALSVDLLNRLLRQAGVTRDEWLAG